MKCPAFPHGHADTVFGAEKLSCLPTPPTGAAPQDALAAGALLTCPQPHASSTPASLAASPHS